VRSNRVGQLRIVLDLAGNADDLGRDFLVELYVAFEFGDDRAAERLDLDRIFLRLAQAMRRSLIEFLARRVAVDFGARGIL
jgi:hypothetical protein